MWRLSRLLKSRVIIGGIVLFVIFCVGLYPALIPSWRVVAVSIALSGDGSILAIGSHQGQVLVYDLAQKRARVNRHRKIGWVSRMALSYGGDRIAISSWNGRTGSSWNGRTEVRQLSGLRLKSVLWQSPWYSELLRFRDRAGDYLIVAPKHAQPSIVRVSSAREPCPETVLPTLEFVRPPGTTIIRRLAVPVWVQRNVGIEAYTDDSCGLSLERVMCAFGDGHIVIWRAPDWQPELAIKCSPGPSAVAFCHASNRILVSDPPNLLLVDTEHHAIVWQRRVAGWHKLATDCGGQLAVTIGGEANEVILWSVTDRGLKEMERIQLREITGLRAYSGWSQLWDELFVFCHWAR